MTHAKRYRYVGPAEIRDQATGAVEAEAAGAVLDLVAERHSEPFTFVVGTDGWLRLAPRRSEHVALAGGEDVLAAGEITFLPDGSGWRVAEVTNQSTGYCPDPDSWPAVGAALDRLGVSHPGDFTDKVIFRRCPACGERNIVRDGDYTCALCDSALPATWNFAAGNGVTRGSG